MTRSSAESHGNFMMVQLHLVRKEDRFGSGATDWPVRDAGRQAREYITAYPSLASPGEDKMRLCTPLVLGYFGDSDRDRWCLGLSLFCRLNTSQYWRWWCRVFGWFYIY